MHGDAENLRAAAATLGEPTRFMLLAALTDSPRSVGELVDLLNVPQPLVSHHLGILLRAGLVCALRRGRSRSYSIADHPDPAVRGLLTLLREVRGSENAGGPLALAPPKESATTRSHRGSPPIEDFLL